MKKTSQQMIDMCNEILSKYNQITRILEWSGTTIVLENGIIFTGNERNKFKRRILNTKTNLWVKNIDGLINGTISENDIKLILCSNGGKAVQEKYGNSIKQNLNTGTPWNKGLTGIAGHSQTEFTRRQISIKNSGKNNGMYGKKMSNADKKKLSELIKKKILSGEFTPNSNNRNTHWESSLDGIKYRSSWEALYKYINPAAEYETLRIEYLFELETKVYIVDFVDKVNKLVIEVKPRNLCSGEKFNNKMAALSAWAEQHGYAILLVDREWFQQQTISVDYTRFDQNTARKIKGIL